MPRASMLTVARFKLRRSRTDTIRLEPLPDNLKPMLADGGLVPHLKKRFASGSAKGGRRMSLKQRLGQAGNPACTRCL
jgi:hypothetical protein